MNIVKVRKGFVFFHPFLGNKEIYSLKKRGNERLSFPVEGECGYLMGMPLAVIPDEVRNNGQARPVAKRRDGSEGYAHPD